MTGPAAHDDIREMGFEEAMIELEAIVGRLESGEAKLDDEIGAYERGAALKRHCEAKLREAQDKVEKISLDADGGVGVEPAEIE